MFNTFFNDNQLIFLSSGLICFLLSLFFHLKDKENLTVIFLILTALSVNCFSALLDPFLNIYDERFHALVAKNLLLHPLKPTLYDDPVVNILYDRWDKYHIWLHKQPLFLWQIALSFRLFGLSEFSLRLPSVILGAVMVHSGYRSGKLLVNSRTGYVTGLLMITSFFSLELMAGRQMVDHNDFSFYAYITLSIWAFIEYHYSGKKRWIFLVGLFSGFAILCKWLAGLLVYSGWFVLKLSERKFKFKDNKDILISALITLLIALPWQIYTFIFFPAEAKLAQQFNVLHISETLEGHHGTFWYHIGQFDTLYGRFSDFLIIPAIFILHKKMSDKKLFLPVMAMIIIVYLFFSFVKTKMPAFPLITGLLIFISLAALVDYCTDFILMLPLKQWIIKLLIALAILSLVIARFDINKIQTVHTLKSKSNSYSRMLLYNKGVFKSLRLPDNAVIFNVKGQHYIECMFYTGLPSYNIIPDRDQYLDIKNKGRIVAVFKPVKDELPAFLLNDPTTIVIDEVLQGYN